MLKIAYRYENVRSINELCATKEDLKNIKHMTRKLLIILSISLYVFEIFGQDSTFISKNAVKFDKQDSLNSEIYRLIKNYQLIMIGEMHGTCEPAKLVIGLAELLARNNNNVQVGLEIPSEKMQKYHSLPIDSNIYLSDYFANKSIDGKATYAWANIIGRLHQYSKIEIFFFDINNGDSKISNNRDSLMYLNIKNRIQLHPTWKTITLSGNTHNMLIPYKGQPKMAFYLYKDKDLAISGKILSLNHSYSKGTMLNNMGKGLQINTVDNSNTIFSRAVNFENYILVYPLINDGRYNGVYFTRKVTSAKLVSEK
jgi:hypothetical protein